MNSERCTELKQQLEYFCLIPVDQITEKIAGEISNCKNPDSELILETTFKYVYNGAFYYYDFFSASKTPTFLMNIAALK